MDNETPYLLIVPGFGETKAVFHEVADEMSYNGDFEVVNPSIPRSFDEGLRDRPADGVATFLANELKRLDDERPVYVLGHSFAADAIFSLLKNRKDMSERINGVILETPTGAESDARYPKARLAGRFAIHLAKGAFDGTKALFKGDFATVKRQVRAGVNATLYCAKAPIRTYREAKFLARNDLRAGRFADIAEETDTQLAFIVRKSDPLFKYKTVMQNLGNLAADSAWIEGAKGDHNEIHVKPGQEHTTGLVLALLSMMQDPIQAKQDIETLSKAA